MVDASGHAIPAAAQGAFLMVQHVMPVGLRGAVVAGLLAALMSSLAGAFNASSTLFTIDFYKLHAGASEHQLVWIGRIATTVMVLIGLLWIPVIQSARSLRSTSRGAVALAPADLRRVLLRRVLQALNGKAVPGGAPHRLRASESSAWPWTRRSR
jgi:SSS family solute:Na+ symporter